MSTYRERREARAERLAEWSAKREAKATAASQHARQMADAIPFGQPILAGHYSEGRDRRYRDRIASSFDKAHEHATKAGDMASRAAGIKAQLDSAIYDDDPDALDRLHERLSDLEAERDRIKAYNASCRKGTPDPSVLDDHQRADLASLARVAAFQLGKGGAFPSYKLSNLSGRIKATRDRITKLLAEASARQAAEEGCEHGFAYRSNCTTCGRAPCES